MAALNAASSRVRPAHSGSETRVIIRPTRAYPACSAKACLRTSIKSSEAAAKSSTLRRVGRTNAVRGCVSLVPVHSYAGGASSCAFALKKRTTPSKTPGFLRAMDPSKEGYEGAPRSDVPDSSYDVRKNSSFVPPPSSSSPPMSGFQGPSSPSSDYPGDGRGGSGSWPPRNFGRGFGFGSSPDSPRGHSGLPAWAVPPLIAAAVIPVIGYKRNQHEIDEAKRREEYELKLKQEADEAKRRSWKGRIKSGLPHALGATLGAGVTWGLVKKLKGDSGFGPLHDIGGGKWWPKDKKAKVPDVKVDDLSPETSAATA